MEVDGDERVTVTRVVDAMQDTAVDELAAAMEVEANSATLEEETEIDATAATVLFDDVETEAPGVPATPATDLVVKLLKP